MHLTRLQFARLRCFDEVALEALEAGVVLFTGANGAGKTSVLEAVHLLGYGRSFRGRVRDGLIRSGAADLQVYAEWRGGNDGRLHRAGLQHAGRHWAARLDGEAVATLADLCAAFAVVTFEPGSHELIAGGAEHRRRFLDWALFHVEPTFLPVWRRFARALKQRNALLKSGPVPAALEPWDRELGEAGEQLTRLRLGFLDCLRPALVETADEFLPELGTADLGFHPGWRREELPLHDALVLSRERDLLLGHTTVGPQRADWQVRYAGLPGRESLSRGQEKLTALACVLAQAREFARARGEWPVICLDDLASELDRPHQEQVLRVLLSSGAQVLLTGTDPPPALRALDAPAQWFHVEQRRVFPRPPAQVGGAL
ncbi:DNA replication/repair protein RecF [Rehaibacterium terrae]|jgi:DNA replication and repair protein RecF|uniref:DNA replication and repair protein RecF n=1 Tax=Rehaibacterium terrae TaxID=1341696 RepID=A0A7W8DE90_9GAMM|nr:DNA replication/repair protein RecF [Rehaibacterium terrae]MBB5015555.1 DNA replication and repair protein RecF [Rehaibacterium terrae]